MTRGLGRPTTTNELIHRLRLIADAGGVLTHERIRTIIEAADRLEDMDERIAIMTEHENPDTSFPYGGGSE